MPAAGGDRGAHRRSCRCATWAPSAAASRMPIRRRIIRRRCRRSKRSSCLKSAKAERTVAAADFFVDTFTTALEPGEIMREVIVPVEDAGTGTSYQKDGPAGQRIRDRRHRGAGSKTAAERSRWRASASRAFESCVSRDGGGEGARRERRDRRRRFRMPRRWWREGADANSDLHASADYRKHLAVVYAARALDGGAVARSRTA